MGCVFFEAIIWLLYGSQTHVGFSEKTTAANTQGSPYWTRRGENAVLSDMASIWITYVLRNDPECQGPKGSTAMGDLLRIVKENLLVVRLPANSDITQDGCRTNAETLLAELKKILDRAETDDAYAFTGKDRSKVKEPPQVGVVNSELGFQVPPRSRQELSVNDARGRGPPSNPRTSRVLEPHSHGHYTRSVDAKWIYVPDDVFAKKFIEKHASEYHELFRFPESAICTECDQLDFERTGEVFRRKMRDLRNMLGGEKCSLCVALYHKGIKAGVELADELVLERIAAGLKIAGKPETIYRVCQSPGKNTSAFYPRISLMKWRCRNL